MKRTIYAAVQFGVAAIPPEANGGEPGRLLQFFEPASGAYIDFPMSVDDAKNLGNKLLGNEIEVATTMPQMPPQAPQPS